MPDDRKGMSSSPAPATPAGKKAGASGTPKIKADKDKHDDEATIKVASKKDKDNKDNKDKDSKDKDGKETGAASKSSGTIKLKKPPPKHKLPGNWKEGTFVDRK